MFSFDMITAKISLVFCAHTAAQVAELEKTWYINLFVLLLVLCTFRFVFPSTWPLWESFLCRFFVHMHTAVLNHFQVFALCRILISWFIGTVHNLWNTFAHLFLLCGAKALRKLYQSSININHTLPLFTADPISALFACQKLVVFYALMKLCW